MFNHILLNCTQFKDSQIAKENSIQSVGLSVLSLFWWSGNDLAPWVALPKRPLPDTLSVTWLNRGWKGSLRCHDDAAQEQEGERERERDKGSVCNRVCLSQNIWEQSEGVEGWGVIHTHCAATHHSHGEGDGGRVRMACLKVCACARVGVGFFRVRLSRC